MTRLVIVLVLTFSCLACEQTAKVEESQGTEEISYRWDRSHNVCFAMIASVGYSGYRSVSITYVPLFEAGCK